MKRLTAPELSRLRRIGREFTIAAELKGEFSESHFEGVWKTLLEADLGVIFYENADDGSVAGVLGATFTPDMFSGRLVGAEAFWFLVPSARGKSLSIRLFNAFEEEAKTRKCQQILMVALTGLDLEIVSGLLLRRGFSALEVVHTKEL